MMDWKDRMRIAMQDMKEACNDSRKETDSCILCPFFKYCIALEENRETSADVFDGLSW